MTKIKINAAELIKYMSEKELKQYKIQVEKEGDNPPSSIPGWFKPYAQKIDLLMEERNKAPGWFKPYAQKIDLLMEERNKTPEWFKEFYKEFKDFKEYVKNQFKKHGWEK